MNALIELIKQIDISKYSQEEYREIVDEIVLHWKANNFDKALDRAGWLDIGGSG